MSEIRPASPLDTEALAALRARAEQQLGTERGGPALLEELPQRLAEAAGLPRSSWVAEGPEGLQAAAVAIREGARGSFALWVDPPARGQGIGRLLATAAISWLRDQGVVDVDSLSLPGDRATKQLLEQLGFKARLLVMRQGG